MKLVSILLSLLASGCVNPTPDRMTLGVQVDADSYELRTFTAQFHWQLRHP